MLFCSSVARDGSVMLAGGVTVSAEVKGSMRPDNCWNPTTVAAAKTAEANAINKICRAEILYISQNSSIPGRVLRCHHASLRLCNAHLQNVSAILQVPEQIPKKEDVVPVSKTNGAAGFA